MIRDYIKKLEKKNMTLSALLIVLGVLLIWKPIGFIKSIVIFIGIILMVVAIIDLVVFMNSQKMVKVNNASLFKGIVELIAGIFLIFRNEFLIDLFPMILGIIIIFNNIFKMQIALNVKQVNDREWIFGFVMSLLCILIGVVIIMNPFKTLETIVRIAGIIILVSEILSLINSAIVLKGIKIVDEAVAVVVSDNVEEAKILEEKTKVKKNKKDE